MKRGLSRAALSIGLVALILGIRAGASRSDDGPAIAERPATSSSTKANDAPPDANSAKTDAAKTDDGGAKAEPAPRELFSGRVVLLGAALKKRGIKSYPEQHEHAVLETEAGALIPIVADWRGRAFFQDERLRDRRVDLVGIRRPGVPYLQVLAVYLFDDKGTRQYMDYWCDICSIPMYELKPCDCCQDKIRLRLQPRDLPDYIQRPARETPAAAPK